MENFEDNEMSVRFEHREVICNEAWMKASLMEVWKEGIKGMMSV